MMSSRCITPALGDRQSGPPLATPPAMLRRLDLTAARAGLFAGRALKLNKQREVNKFISITDRDFVTGFWEGPWPRWLPWIRLWFALRW